MKGVKLLQDTFDTTHEIGKLIKFSPKRETLFKKLKEDLQVGGPGFRLLCPTRWTVRANSLKSIMELFCVAGLMGESPW